jgi:phosphoglycerol transferase MdoB-like AlkP superfamily enzyme
LINPILYNINEFLSDQQLTSSNSDTTVSYDSYFRSTIGNHKKKNIIVIFAESFEPKYSSTNSTGLHDYLPKFDALQKDGVKYTNFFAP